jgi:hypothetical protein
VVHSAAVVPAENEDSSDDEEEDGAARGAENRQYIKELLTAHPIWKDGTYWEQTLWQCAIEQVRAQNFVALCILLLYHRGVGY